VRPTPRRAFRQGEEVWNGAFSLVAPNQFLLFPFECAEHFAAKTSLPSLPAGSRRPGEFPPFPLRIIGELRLRAFFIASFGFVFATGVAPRGFAEEPVVPRFVAARDAVTEPVTPRFELTRVGIAAPATPCWGLPCAPAPPKTEAEMWMEVGRAMEDLTRAFAWVELAFPDLRLQTPARVGDGVDALVLSWPVHVVGVSTRAGRSGAGATFFVEPAFPTDHLAARGLGGVRLWGADAGTGLAAVLEGGGMAGTDGHGAFAGGGPAIGDLRAVVALVGRRYFVLGADRWDFTLELTMPYLTLAELLGD